jgi:hypothetical protein
MVLGCHTRPSRRGGRRWRALGHHLILHLKAPRTLAQRTVWASGTLLKILNHRAPHLANSVLIRIDVHVPAAGRRAKLLPHPGPPDPRAPVPVGGSIEEGYPPRQLKRMDHDSSSICDTWAAAPRCPLGEGSGFSPSDRFRFATHSYLVFGTCKYNEMHAEPQDTERP